MLEYEEADEEEGGDWDYRSRQHPSPGGVAGGPDRRLARVAAPAAQVTERTGPTQGHQGENRGSDDGRHEGPTAMGKRQHPPTPRPPGREAERGGRVCVLH